MKIMVMPIDMEIGGSEINALDLAIEVHHRGHEVVVIGRPGPLTEVAERAGVRVLAVPIARRARPNPLSSRAIRDAIRTEMPDLVHVYEAHSCTEAFFSVGFGRGRRVPLVATLYGMNVDEFMPRAVPMIAGTYDLQLELATSRDPGTVFLLDPPINTDANCPDRRAGHHQRVTWGVADDEELVVIVSRLDIWMKIDSLMDSIDAVDLLAGERRIRLAVVGDGPARQALEHRASKVNQRHGRRVVDVVGHMLDPVPAYQAADVVVGMGTSLLRGMSAGKPAVLVGELGHVELIESSTMQPYLRQGFWGMGDGTRATGALAGLIAEVLDRSPEDRQRLGDFGRSFVIERFGLQSSTDHLLDMYSTVLSLSPSPRLLMTEVVRVPLSVALRKVKDRLPARRQGVRALGAPADLGDHYLSANAFLPQESAESRRPSDDRENSDG